MGRRLVPAADRQAVTPASISATSGRSGARFPHVSRTSFRLVLGYVVLAAVDAWLAGSTGRSARRARLATKPLLMPALAASLATDTRAQGSPLRGGTLVAQACGWGGDVALLRAGTAAFATGTGCFGAGHATYARGFWRHRDRRRAPWHTPAARVAVASLVAGGPLMALGAAREHRALGPAVLGYTGLLSAVLATAGNLGPALPRSTRIASLAGAALFVASDSLLGLRAFWWHDAPERTETVVMATYTAAQLLLCEAARTAGG